MTRYTQICGRRNSHRKGAYTPNDQPLPGRAEIIRRAGGVKWLRNVFGWKLVAVDKRGVPLFGIAA